MMRLAHLKKPAAALALLLCLLLPVLLASPALSQEGHSEPAHGAAAEHGGAAAHEGGGGHGGANLALDWVKRVLNFAVLMGVIVYFVRKPVGEFFSGRREQIATQLSDLERARDEAKAQLRDYEARLAQAGAEREKILAEFIAQGEAEKRRILAEAEASAGRIRDAARLTIEAEVKAAKRQIREELAEAAVELAAKQLRAEIKADDHGRLIDEYLTKVVELK